MTVVVAGVCAVGDQLLDRAQCAHGARRESGVVNAVRERDFLAAHGRRDTARWGVDGRWYEPLNGGDLVAEGSGNPDARPAVWCSC